MCVCWEDAEAWRVLTMCPWPFNIALHPLAQTAFCIRTREIHFHSPSRPHPYGNNPDQATILVDLWGPPLVANHQTLATHSPNDYCDTPLGLIRSNLEHNLTPIFFSHLHKGFYSSLHKSLQLDLSSKIISLLSTCSQIRTEATYTTCSSSTHLAPCKKR